LRILLVSDYSTLTGGVEIYQNQLRTLLREAGHDVHLFASRVGPEDLRVADTECWGSRQRHINRLLQTFNPFALIKLKRVISLFKPHVVHLNLFLTQLSPSILLAFGKVPVVYTAHMYRMICPLGQKWLPDGGICRDLAGRACLANGCLPPSLWLIDMAQRKLLGRCFHHIDAVWANSLCTARFLESSGIVVDRVQNYFLTTPYRDVPLPDGRPTAGFVGRLVPEKGVDILLHAMSRVLVELPSARLLIVGDGKDKERLHTLCRELELEDSVEFLGYLPPEGLVELWSRIHVQVVPSLWAEPFGLVAPEAMAAGRAVIATLGGGLEESVIDSETGFLVKPGDADQLADRLTTLLADSRRCKMMGHRGMEVCLEKFDNARLLAEHLAGYEALSQNSRDLPGDLDR
jgi:glycosyltransferase involved in cell wall biosynthesis